MRALNGIRSWPVSASAAGVVRRGAAGERPAAVGTAGDVGRAFLWASITKMCTALAVLVACEEGTLSLEDPAGPPGATVAHLLAHASGLGTDGRTPLAPPGERRIYSNGGFEILADLVAERAAMTFSSYLHEAVLAPAGLEGASLPEGASAAWGMTGTVRDLMALGAELLSPTVISGETLERATTGAFPGLAGVLPGFGRQDPCDWGLGFEIRDAKRPHWTGATNAPETFGHFGRSGGFLWVDPRAGAACAVLTDREFGSWAAGAWPVLSDAVVAELAGARAG